MSVDLGLLEAPRTSGAALRDEVERRAAGLRRRRSIHRLEAGLAAIAMTLVAILVSTTADPAPRRVRTVPADQHPVESFPEAPALGTGAGAEQGAPSPPTPPAPATSPKAPTTGTSDGTPAARDRTRVLLHHNTGLFEADANGSDPVRLRAASLHAAWSPDGRTLAVAEGSKIVLFDAATGTETLVFESEVPDVRAEVTSSPAWVPDGRSLVFVRSPSLIASVSVWRLDLATRAATRITLPRAKPALNPSPKMHPDGRILYACREEAGHLCLSDFAGRDLGVVNGTTVSEGFAGFAWSPDGEWIALTTPQGSTSALALVRPDGTGQRTLVREHVSGPPAWRPDGRGLYFGWVDRDDGPVAPCFVNADGSGLRLVGGVGNMVVGTRVG